MCPAVHHTQGAASRSQLAPHLLSNPVSRNETRFREESRMATGSIAERQEHSEGKVAKTIERSNGKAAVRYVPLGRRRVDGDVDDVAAHGEQARQPVRRPVGAHVSHFRFVQQAGEAARIRSDRARRVQALRGAAAGGSSLFSRSHHQPCRNWTPDSRAWHVTSSWQPGSNLWR